MFLICNEWFCDLKRLSRIIEFRFVSARIACILQIQLFTRRYTNTSNKLYISAAFVLQLLILFVVSKWKYPLYSFIGLCTTDSNLANFWRFFITNALCRHFLEVTGIFLHLPPWWQILDTIQVQNWQQVNRYIFMENWINLKKSNVIS